MPDVADLRLKNPRDFRYIGKGRLGIVDLRGITTGTAVYGADHSLPGMKFAVVARPPVVGGKLVSFDAKDALAVPGVEKVIEVKLSDEAKANLQVSVDAVKELLEACKGIDGSLA